MSVLIKGIDAKFVGEGACAILNNGSELVFVESDRIIPIPDHGDLIDRDALKRLRKCELDEYSDGWTFKELWEEEEKGIDSLPAVIPAERSEE